MLFVRCVNKKKTKIVIFKFIHLCDLILCPCFFLAYVSVPSRRCAAARGSAIQQPIKKRFKKKKS